jgi:hypothetical protein
LKNKINNKHKYKIDLLKSSSQVRPATPSTNTFLTAQSTKSYPICQGKLQIWQPTSLITYYIYYIKIKYKITDIAIEGRNNLDRKTGPNTLKFPLVTELQRVLTIK